MMFGQDADGYSTVTLPKRMGEASVNEMLIAGQKLTGQGTCVTGLVSQVSLQVSPHRL